MAALTFPLTAAQLADLLRIRQIKWRLTAFQEWSGLGTGEGLAHDLGPRLWEGDGETVPMENAEAKQVMAMFESLDGGINPFLLYDPMSVYPAGDPTGSIYGASTPQIHTVDADKKRIRVKGLPSDYVITKGDLVSVIYNTSRYALHRSLETVTAVAGVTPLFEVRPHVRPGIGADDAVSLVKPVAKVKLLPDGVEMESVSTIHALIRFRVRQTLAA